MASSEATDCCESCVSYRKWCCPTRCDGRSDVSGCAKAEPVWLPRCSLPIIFTWICGSTSAERLQASSTHGNVCTASVCGAYHVHRVMAAEGARASERRTRPAHATPDFFACRACRFKSRALVSMWHIAAQRHGGCAVLSRFHGIVVCTSHECSRSTQRQRPCEKACDPAIKKVAALTQLVPLH